MKTKTTSPLFLLLTALCLLSFINPAFAETKIYVTSNYGINYYQSNNVYNTYDIYNEPNVTKIAYATGVTSLSGDSKTLTYTIHLVVLVNNQVYRTAKLSAQKTKSYAMSNIAFAVTPKWYNSTHLIILYATSFYISSDYTYNFFGYWIYNINTGINTKYESGEHNTNQANSNYAMVLSNVNITNGVGYAVAYRQLPYSTHYLYLVKIPSIGSNPTYTAISTSTTGFSNMRVIDFVNPKLYVACYDSGNAGAIRIYVADFSANTFTLYSQSTQTSDYSNDANAKLTVEKMSDGRYLFLTAFSSGNAVYIRANVFNLTDGSWAYAGGTIVTYVYANLIKFAGFVYQLQYPITPLEVYAVTETYKIVYMDFTVYGLPSAPVFNTSFSYGYLDDSLAYTSTLCNIARVKEFRLEADTSNNLVLAIGIAGGIDFYGLTVMVDETEILVGEQVKIEVFAYKNGQPFAYANITWKMNDYPESYYQLDSKGYFRNYVNINVAGTSKITVTLIDNNKAVAKKSIFITVKQKWDYTPPTPSPVSPTVTISQFLPVFLLVFSPALLLGFMTRSIVGLVVGLVLGVVCGFVAGMLPLWTVFLMGLAVILLLFRGVER